MTSAMMPPVRHDHVFLGASHQRNERRTWFVIALTTSMMVLEITAGTLFGSMALVADGWHMSTHAAAMAITAFAYAYARHHARNARFTFGTGKLGELAAFSSAIVLALIALFIGWESAVRLFNPVPIDFQQAIAVAVLGLIVNLVSAWLLKDDHDHHHHGHGHHHGEHHGQRIPRSAERGHEAHGHEHHAHDHHGHAAHDHLDHDHDRHGHHHEGDHDIGARGHRPSTVRDNNLRAAYLHVLADALTSVLAIFALLGGSFYGFIWMDPVMGIVGGLVIARWSWGLIRDSGAVLLDAVPDDGLSSEILREFEKDGAEIVDLHLWQIGPGHNAAIVSIVAVEPRPVAEYKALLAHLPNLSHVTVEVHQAHELSRAA